MTAFGEYCRSLKEKIVGDPLPPERVAAGWALGMFIGCAIPFGFQLVVSIPLAVAFRISKIGATLGTLITNPVTIFFIYPAQTWVVDQLLFGGHLSYESLRDVKWTWESVRGLGMEVIVSFFLGGLLLALICTPITYIIVKRIAIFGRRPNH